MEQNKEKVEHRQILLREKIKKKLEKEKEEEIEKIQLKAKLEKLAASVPYYERITNEVQSDIHKKTKNMLIENVYKGNQSCFKKDCGYDDKTLFKDVKFRIVNELRAAGLTTNPYAHEVIVQMNAPRDLAPFASGYF